MHRGDGREFTTIPCSLGTFENHPGQAVIGTFETKMAARNAKRSLSDGLTEKIV